MCLCTYQHQLVSVEVEGIDVLETVARSHPWQPTSVERPVHPSALGLDGQSGFPALLQEAPSNLCLDLESFSIWKVRSEIADPRQ